MDNKQVGLNVKIARVKRKMTINELAKKANMSVTTISRLERGIGQVRMLTLQKIAEALDMEVETFLNE